MNAFEPGRVAVATVRGVPNVRVMRYKEGASGDWFSDSRIHGAYYSHLDSQVTDVRPLVVLDIPDEHVEFVVDILLQPRHVWTNDVAAQIEAQTKPRIPEPTGLGAVVEDRDGTRWSLIGTHRPGLWRADRELSMQVEWALIDVARVLSEGVTS